MSRTVLTLVVATVFALAQEPPHDRPAADAAAPAVPVPQQGGQGVQHGDVRAGGADAVHPPGEVDSHAEAAARHGEAHSEQHAMPNEIWWKLANFILFASALGWLLSRYAGPFFRSRTEEIQSGIATATRTREDAEKRAAEIERRVQNLSAEVESLRERSRDEISREGERVRAETEAAIRKIQIQAEAEIASAAKHATAELKAHAASLALDLAEKQIQGRIDGSAQDALAADFVQDLRRKAVRQ